ncbi:MAG: ribonuclease R [Pantoea sp. Brub]|nr:ribonuclease R [Pantoea sp. Brub]
MLRDPFYNREAQKYKSPIPSREFILEILKKCRKPANKKELIQKMCLQNAKHIKALSRRLRAMERDGQLISDNQYYYILKQDHLLSGKIIGHRDGYGFLRIENKKEDYYLSAEQMQLCMHGDIINAKLIIKESKRRPEVKVINIHKPRSTKIIGRYFNKSNKSFVVPYDSRLNFNIIVPVINNMNAITGSIVVVDLIKRPFRNIQAIGKIIEVLGTNVGTKLAIDIALRTYEIPYNWPQEVLIQINNLNSNITEKDKIGRVDLRQLPLITIDDEDARDFDDAVYCKKQHNGNWLLWVAVADVSYYVRPGTALDHEAYLRGTSIYFPSIVIPMLPEKLSNELCSLNPKVDCLCMVCEMNISSNGKLISFRHYEAIMNSHARLTYSEALKMLNNNYVKNKQSRLIIQNIKQLYQLYQILERARHKRGGISFETTEAKFIFNDEYRIKRIEHNYRNEIHKMIEECMILANIASAIFIEKSAEPALFRDHDRPSEKNIKSFNRILNQLGLVLSGGNKPNPIDYASLLIKIAERPDAEMIQSMLLRSMKQAIYDPYNRGHFGLALKSYAHFTSPIRRYPDLLLHRSIKYLLSQEKISLRKIFTLENGGYHYQMSEMIKLGQHCSFTERRADEATRNVFDWLKCDFMKNKIGSTFEGVISNVTNFGFFVRLNKLLIDGLIHISTLNNDHYQFDPIGQCLIGKSGMHIYRLGDSVKVYIESVNIHERKIDCILIN